jgi:hypothetical protein
MKHVILIAALLLTVATPCHAEIRYFKDPIYKTLAPEDHHPMQDMIDLASNGDAEAQFILGDLYSKGKGGLVKSIATGRTWFEKSAYNGQGIAFIRLAALAKKAEDFKSAYQWYVLASDSLSGDARSWAFDQRKILVKEKKITPQDIRDAAKAAREWRQQMDQRQREEEEKMQQQKKAAQDLIGPPPPAIAALSPEIQGPKIQGEIAP